MAERDPGDNVGALALADTTLGELIQHIVRAVPDASPMRAYPTTNQAADALKSELRKRPGLFPVGAEDWIGRVKDACGERNAIIHAAATDRCVYCGGANNFIHHAEAVDRSPERIASLTDRIDQLTREGVSLADEVSRLINGASVEDAKRMAAETGEVQTPAQILIVQSRFECDACSETGRSHRTIRAATAMEVFPPGTDIKRLFGGESDS